MLVNPICYQGPLHNFTFTKEEGQLRARVVERNNLSDLKHYDVRLPLFPSSSQPFPPAQLLSHMLENGFYPYVSNGIVKLAGSLLGGMRRAAQDAEVRTTVRPDSKTRWDWSSPMQQVDAFQVRAGDEFSYEIMILKDSSPIAYYISTINNGPNLKLKSFDGKLIVNLVGHQAPVNCLIELENGRLATCSKDKTIKIWNKQGQCLRTINATVGDIAALRNGTILASSVVEGDHNAEGSVSGFPYDRVCQIFDQEGKTIGKFRVKASRSRFEQNSNNLLSFSSFSGLQLFDQTGKYIETISELSYEKFRLANIYELKDEVYALVSDGRSNTPLRVVDKSGKVIWQTNHGYYEVLRPQSFVKIDEETFVVAFRDARMQAERVRSSEKDNLTYVGIFNIWNGLLQKLDLEANFLCWKGDRLWVYSSREEKGKIYQPLRVAARKTVQFQGNMEEELEKELKLARQLLTRYRQTPDFDAEYVAELEKWFDHITRIHSKKSGRSHIATSIEKIKEVQRDLNDYLAEASPETMQKSFEKHLAELMGETEAKILQIQAQYEAMGEAVFSRLLQRQQKTFEAVLEEKLMGMSIELTRRHKQLFIEALQKVLKGTALGDLLPSQLDELKESLLPQLGKELEIIVQSIDFQGRVQELQQTVLDEIAQRQTLLVKEMIHAQREQAKVKDKQSLLYREYEAKQVRLQEQQSLQNPATVRAFYNTTEKHLSARLMGAIVLVSGLIVRTETGLEKGAKVGAAALETLCSAIPVVGDVVGGVLSFGIQAGSSALVDREQKKKQHAAFDGVVRFDEAMAIAELAARRVAQGFRSHLQTTSVEAATAAGERAAGVMYDFIQAGQLKALAGLTREEKIEALVQAVRKASERESGFFGKKGRVFKQAVAMSPGASREVVGVRQDVHNLNTKIELLTKHQEVMFSQIKSIESPDEQEKAIAHLRIHGAFDGEKFALSHNKKYLSLSHLKKDLLEKIAFRLTSAFASSIIEDCDIDRDSLIITARSSLLARSLIQILTKWLTIV